MPSTTEFAAGSPPEQTKFKALAFHYGQRLSAFKVLDKKEAFAEPDADRVGLVADMLKMSVENKKAYPSTTKPDVRFPNTNQAGNCWCVMRR